MCEFCRQFPCPSACPNFTPVVCAVCDECGAEIYEDDDYYIISGMVLCPECIENSRRTAEVSE